MSNKRDQAFELFNQGKQPSDPGVVALGIKTRTARDYYNKWKKTQSSPGPGAGPEPGGNEVEISSLGTLQLFMYEGCIYSKRKVQSGGIKALTQEGDALITLPPDTLVTPL